VILGAVLPYFFLQFFDVGVQVARLVAAPYLLDRNCRLHLRYLRRIAAVVSAVVVSAVSGVDVSASAVHTATATEDPAAGSILLVNLPTSETCCNTADCDWTGNLELEFVLVPLVPLVFNVRL